MAYERDGDTEDENDYECKENSEVLNGTTRTITLQTLMNANILQPGKSLMTIDYLGQKFVGDLMADGKIKSQETETLFLTPSAWAMYCKRIINPEKKSGCGWASVKYKGKKLDAYKNSWLRKCSLQKDVNIDDLDSDVDKGADNIESIIKRGVYSYNTVSNRNFPHDGNTLIKAVPFTSVGKVQPFLVEFSSSALLLADFHCHLTMKEVCGYFGGHWDINTHTLTITRTYPCRATHFASRLAVEEELKIKDLISKDQLLLVGWYHSHPLFQAEPSLRDCDAQLDFQIRMRGSSDVTYTPCISTIISPYYDGNSSLESNITPFWVMPTIETKHILEYGRPMLLVYSVLSDMDLSQYLRCELRTCAEYYSLQKECVKFDSIFSEDITFIEKLKSTLHSKFPVNQNNTTLWNWICKILGCDIENEFIPPKKVNKTDAIPSYKRAKVQYSTESLTDESGNDLLSNKSLKVEKSDFDKKGNEIKVMSLQEQLCLPSGLNMNPVRTFAPLATPNPLVAGNVSSLVTADSIASCKTTTNSVVPTKHSDELNRLQLAPKYGSIISASSSLPTAEIKLRDSPITVPSSPVKSFEIAMQSPPSPPKLETSFRLQNSPNESSRNSSNLTQSNLSVNKTDSPNTSKPPLAIFHSPTNDLVAASLAQFAGHISPTFLQTDLSSLFQQQLTEKNFSNSSIKPLISEKNGEQKNETVASAYSSLQNQEILGNPKIKTDSQRLSLPPNFSSNASNVYKTKLMKELDNIKNDPLKINELIRSPEYASLLLHQAEALGATTLGTLGLGSDLNFLTGSNFGSKENSSQHPDYNNLVTASKVLGYESCVPQGKLDDLDRFLQQQISAVAAAALVNASLSSGTSKKQTHADSQPQADFSSLLQTYSKLFEAENSFRDSINEAKSTNNAQNDFAPLLSAGINNDTPIYDPNTKPKDVISRTQQKQNEGQNHVQNSLFYQQCKSPSDISTFFPTSSAVTNLAITSKVVSSNASSANMSVPSDSAMYYSAFPQDKIQDYPYLQQQHEKEDSKFFISPAAMMKIQKDSLSAMMMKPPKSSTSTSPALTPTKTGGISPGTSTSANAKYNFSAIDLAVSSIQPNTSILVPFEPGNTSVSLRKPPNTPPVDLSSFYNESQPPSNIGSIKKRMEFSSVAELAAPPPEKQSKRNEDKISNI